MSIYCCPGCGSSLVVTCSAPNTQTDACDKATAPLPRYIERATEEIMRWLGSQPATAWWDTKDQEKLRVARLTVMAICNALARGEHLR